MTKENQNFTMYSGDTREIRWTIYQSDEVTPQVITNYRIRWWLSKYSATTGKFTATPSLKKSSTDGTVTILDSTAGYVEVTLNPADTDPLNGTYYHEMELMSQAGKISTVSVGLVTIKPDLVVST